SSRTRPLRALRLTSPRPPSKALSKKHNRSKTSTNCHGSFMPVPPYPRESLARHLATASKSAASEGSKRADPNARRVGRHPPTIAPTDPPAVQLRRSQITGGFSIDKSALLLPS